MMESRSVVAKGGGGESVTRKQKRREILGVVALFCLLIRVVDT
jgi:hypothetical protein